MPSYLAHLVVAGLDVGRFHWSGHVRSRVQMAGLTVSATSWGLVLCAMAVNRFFAATVRLQTEG
jgi:small neutral amino acid transporter SnatA (MarC family)